VVEADNANWELAADAALWPRLRAACAAVRGSLPDLPIELRVTTARRTTRYAWSPDDAAADVEMAFDALIASGSYDRGGVHGWYRSVGQWQAF
jgi:ketosteroid isomerase-like protein